MTIKIYFISNLLCAKLSLCQNFSIPSYRVSLKIVLNWKDGIYFQRIETFPSIEIELKKLMFKIWKRHLNVGLEPSLIFLTPYQK